MLLQVQKFVQEVGCILASTATGGPHILHVLRGDQGGSGVLPPEAHEDVLWWDVCVRQGTDEVFHVSSQTLVSVFECH